MVIIGVGDTVAAQDVTMQAKVLAYVSRFATPQQTEAVWDTRLPLCCWSWQPSQEDLPAWRCHTQMQNPLHIRALVIGIHTYETCHFAVLILLNVEFVC